jgi:dienelactone hydrolase
LTTLVALVLVGCGPAASGSGSASAASPVDTSPPPSAAPSTTASPTATESPIPSVDVAAARSAFDYPAVEGAFEVLSSKDQGGATVRDVTYASVGGRTVSAWLVEPGGKGPFPAALFLHWYATNEPDGNRTEFLDEAVELAGTGVVSLLPQEVFPWSAPPAGAAADRQAVIDQVVDLRVGLDRLLARPNVDPKRVAVVGHDFGGMYAALIAGLDRRVDAAVVMAGVPHFADWYLRYWHPVPRAEEPAYKATMLDVDPVTFLPDAPGALLFQFASSDRYVSTGAIDTWTAAAPQGAQTKTYDWNHSLRTEAARQDRDDFLTTGLGVD